MLKHKFDSGLWSLDSHNHLPAHQVEKSSYLDQEEWKEDNSPSEIVGE